MSVSVDTNILVYIVDNRDLEKQRIAVDVLRALDTASGLIALQVIGEFQHAVVRRLKQPHTFAVASASKLLTTFETFSYDKSAVEHASGIFATRRLSYWDALLIASSARAGVRWLISEDMGDGMTIGGVEIINPFAAGVMSARAQAALGI